MEWGGYAGPGFSCFPWLLLLLAFPPPPLSPRPWGAPASPSLCDGWWCRATLTPPSSLAEEEEEEEEQEDEREGWWSGGEESVFLAGASPTRSRLFSGLWGWRGKWGCWGWWP